MAARLCAVRHDAHRLHAPPWFEGAIALPHDGDGAARAQHPQRAQRHDDLPTAGDYALRACSDERGRAFAGASHARFNYELELRDGGCGVGEGLLPPAACRKAWAWALAGWCSAMRARRVSHRQRRGEQAIAFFVPERRPGVVILNAHGARLQIVAALTRTRNSSPPAHAAAR